MLFKSNYHLLTAGVSSARGAGKLSIACLLAGASLMAIIPTVRADITTGFGSNFSGSANSSPTNGTITLNLNSAGNSTQGVSSGVLRLTTRTDSQATSAWFNTLQHALSNSWTASFTWTGSIGTTATSPVANGFFFAVQNNNSGLNLLGGTGGNKGLLSGGTTAPAKSLGIGVDDYVTKPVSDLELYSTDGSGNKYNGAIVDTGYGQTGNTYVDFNADAIAGTPIAVTISYNGDKSLTFDATQGSHNFSYTYTLGASLATILGGNDGYVGITGGTGGAVMNQYISNFQFTETAVPEPAPGLLILAGLGGLALLGGSRYRSRTSLGC